MSFETLMPSLEFARTLWKRQQNSTNLKKITALEDVCGSDEINYFAE